MAKAKVTHKNSLDIVANPRVEKGLTPMQEKFAMIYATEEVTQTEAALRAGYAESNAHSIASHMLNGRNYPQVLNRVYEIKKELQHKYEVTFESHVQKLAQLREEILHGKIDQMSKEEVLTEIKRIQQDYPALVEATSPVIEMDKLEVLPDGKEP